MFLFFSKEHPLFMAWRIFTKRTAGLSKTAYGQSLLDTSLFPQRSLFFPAFRGALAMFSASSLGIGPEEYAKRNYANNISEYNTVLGSLTVQRRYFLLRDVYDDMQLDGVQPIRDTFHTLIVGAMKGARLQDSLYFMDEMKSMGMAPDTTLYNFIISTCGKSKNSDCAIQLLENMKRSGVKLKGQTYITFLCACASTGQVDQVYAIVRDMTAAGLGLNKFCYAGLITAFKNRQPVTEETTSKIIELVKQSKGWSSVEASSGTGDSGMLSVTEEELYNIPAAEFVHRRSFINRQLTVYHTALHACADLGSKESVDTLMEMLKGDGDTPDIFCVIQVMRCYLHCRDIEGGKQVFDEYVNSGKLLAVELYTTLAQGAMIGHTPKGMEIAREALEKMTARGWFLTPRLGGELLTIASGEQIGGFTTANYIWDLMQARHIVPPLTAVEAYHKGLMERDIPKDDPRLTQINQALSEVQRRRQIFR
ncbi:pentatricopeptide repeat-containing protein At4g35850, mitochondrial [Cryptomeria japonica]|uniref:pentatricopeptide repeat-containing protein At4g35850, mitochondrial n=1 Tax=Cryptomeria japonica TaxID=3369 RepID=UPI0025ABA61C|nr:pentatricopeptide repeat-containing protein At4g35850, mitochondrial [Cryptomeria japonica]XP_057864997.1 pentatricopeptide repeat-containing protein At4g35850, mitochondrial [Cryptomeria japonica]